MLAACDVEADAAVPWCITPVMSRLDDVACFGKYRAELALLTVGGILLLFSITRMLKTCRL